HRREVVVGAARDRDVVALAAEALDEPGAEEPGAPVTDDRPPPPTSFGAPVGNQSTRPSQRSRFSAYQRIVRSTPSSQLTLGCHPVSRVTFAWPTLREHTSARA